MSSHGLLASSTLLLRSTDGLLIYGDVIVHDPIGGLGRLNIPAELASAPAWNISRSLPFAEKTVHRPRTRTGPAYHFASRASRMALQIAVSFGVQLQVTDATTRRNLAGAKRPRMSPWTTQGRLGSGGDRGGQDGAMRRGDEGGPRGDIWGRRKQAWEIWEVGTSPAV
jgi:hypothetical protein